MANTAAAATDTDCKQRTNEEQRWKYETKDNSQKRKKLKCKVSWLIYIIIKSSELLNIIYYIYHFFTHALYYTLAHADEDSVCAVQCATILLLFAPINAVQHAL